jgi:hypothetical protein
MQNSISGKMKASGFTASNGGIDIDKEGIMKSSNAKLSVTGNVRNKGEMSLEDTDVKIEGNLDNEGKFSMNEKKVILEIIKAMKDNKPNTETINKSLAELYKETNDKSKFHRAIEYIKKNVKWEFEIGLVGGIPKVNFKIGSN